MTEAGKRLLEGLHLHGGHDTSICDWRPEPHIAAVEAKARAARNAEITAEVRGLELPSNWRQFKRGALWDEAIAAVLAFVER